MVYGYIRVSTDKQNVENQRFEIQRFCDAQNLRIDYWIEETISGTIPWEKRALGKLLRRTHGDDLLLCSELSRLGRSLFMILDVLNHCLRRKVRVWTIKDNYRLCDDITSKVLAFALGLSAEIERNLISQRTREALARRRALGQLLGRPRGSQLSLKLRVHDTVIRRHLQRGSSISQLARKLRVSRQTLVRYIDRWDIYYSTRRKPRTPPMPMINPLEYLKDRHQDIFREIERMLCGETFAPETFNKDYVNPWG